jgi:hypothetical protein
VLPQVDSSQPAVVETRAKLPAASTGLIRLPRPWRDAILGSMKMAVAAAAVAAVAATLMSGCLISPIPIGGGKSSNQIQHEGLGKLFPVQLAPLTKWTGEVRVAKVRVWADDEYRAQNVRWQHGFDEQLDYANQVLIQLYGVAATIAWCGIGTFVILKVVDLLTPLRASREQEIAGLDISLHGESLQ